MGTVKLITSFDNSIIKGISKLKRKKDRDLEGCYLIEGFNLVEEAIIYGELKTVLFKESIVNTDDYRGIIERIKQNNINVFIVSGHVFDKISDTKTPQGVISVVKKKIWNYDNFFGKDRICPVDNVLVIDRLQDPGNLGTIFRTADAAGYRGAIVLKGTADAYNMKTVRAAAGSIFRFPILFIDSSKEAVEILKQNGKSIVSTTPYCQRQYYEENLQNNIALVIGNEGSGISKELMEYSDSLVKIPMVNSVESLNAAVASAIIIYESVRQNHIKQ